MKRLRLKLINLFIFLSLLACNPPTTSRITSGSEDALSSPTANVGGEGGAAPGDSSVGGDTIATIAKVELRHIIEPKVDDNSEGGSYKRKLTIPKNYDGLLYLAGVNITTLNSQNVKVRFNFGRNSSPITLQATVDTGAGITPQTNVEVLVIDMESKPFEDINLLYDLYDYNNYDFDQTGTQEDALTEPVSFNRDDNLFCRGLSLKDDPTFTGNLTDGCAENGDVCKYAYASVKDKGLVEVGTGANPDVPITPSELSVEVGTDGLYGDTDEVKLKRCLPDDPTLTFNAYTYDNATAFLTFGTIEAIGGINYIYRGPYQPFNVEEWEVRSEALKGKYGVFGEIFDDNSNGFVDDNEIEFGYQSKLFPLYTKFNFLSGVEYLGSNTPHGAKGVIETTSNSESQYMDGCNERVTTVHEITGEHIGSCNVTATIEIISIDDETGKETVVDISDEVKLQLVKPSVLDTEGENVLLSSFRSCSSTSQCGSDACCINKRCWSKSIVSQCVEDFPSFGNLEPGDQCSSDYQCSSLCCNETNGKCAPHDPNGEDPVFCSKNSGQKCVSSEFCATTPIPVCAIVRTGRDAQGGITCALRCITVEKQGRCIAQDSDGTSFGTCVPAEPEEQPDFNPDDPNRCEGAITIDELFDQANQS